MQSMIGIAFNILGSLCLFLYGMRVMSNGIQKSAGNHLELFFNRFASNRYLGFFIGLVVTATIQSSSATTVMIVSFANIGAIKLQQAISLIMGANVGTTVTAWIVSLFGFKFNIATYVVPLLAIGFPMFFAKKDSTKGFGEFVVGFALLFMGLEMLKDSIPTLNPDVIAEIAKFNATNLLSAFLIALAGMLITEIVQSSSASTTICLALVAKGVLPFEMALMFMLGANVGTTITAFLASLGTTITARRVAWAHIIFNVVGAGIWVLAYKWVIVSIVWLCELIKLDDIVMRLALFHTVFNLFWSIVYLPLLTQYANLVEKIVVDKDGGVNSKTLTASNYHLEYNDATFQGTPEILISLAKREILHMANVIKEMTELYMSVFSNPNEDKSKEVERILEGEKLIDVMQERIGEFLVRCSQTNLSTENRHNIRALLTVINSLESVADTLENLTKICKLRHKESINIRGEAQEDLNAYFNKVVFFLDFMSSRLNKRLSKIDLKEAETIEKSINNERNRLKDKVQSILSGDKEVDVKGELLVLDTIRYTEQMGDHFMAIAHALRSLIKV